MTGQTPPLTRGGIPVCAHIGFTPQSEHALGGYRVQGRGEAAERILADARAVQEAGAFAVVMEMVPADVARQISEELTIPTIGIGAGNGCDGQVLVGRTRSACVRARWPSSSSSTPMSTRSCSRRQGVRRRRPQRHLPRRRALVLTRPSPTW